MPTITLKRDIYGTNARASAIADFVELASLSNDMPTEAELADRLADSKVTIPREKYVRGDDEEDPDSGDDPEDPEEEQRLGGGHQRYVDSAGRVFDLLHERASTLGPRYPFVFDNGRLTTATPNAQHDAYLALLAMTAAHAYKVVAAPDPKRVFETVVVRVLVTRGWRASSVAANSAAQGGAGGFPEALATACAAVGLEPDLSDVSLSSWAQDEGVDTLAHHPWRDNRPGRWTLIGQATVGRSDTWSRKLGEPKLPTWRRLLGGDVPPQPFLAVPHHVEPGHLRKLVEESEKVVLDRLRLAHFADGVSREEHELIDAVRGCVVEYR